jgi:hypothetical protein
MLTRRGRAGYSHCKRSKVSLGAVAQGDPNAPYEVVQLENLDAWLDSEFTWRKSGPDWIYHGKCFRCGHEVDKVFTSEGIFAYREEGAVDPEARAMRCNCYGTHEGREGGDGCGAWWGLDLEPNETAG